MCGNPWPTLIDAYLVQFTIISRCIEKVFNVSESPFATKQELEHHKEMHNLKFDQLMGEVKNITSEIKDISTQVKATVDIIRDDLSDLKEHKAKSELKWKIVTTIAVFALSAAIGGIAKQYF